jgi:hypothetical protein
VHILVITSKNFSISVHSCNLWLLCFYNLHTHFYKHYITAFICGISSKNFQFVFIRALCGCLVFTIGTLTSPNIISACICEISGKNSQLGFIRAICGCYVFTIYTLTFTNTISACICGICGKNFQFVFIRTICGCHVLTIFTLTFYNHYLCTSVESVARIS